MITKTGSIRKVPLEQTAPPVLERDAKISALVKVLAKLLQDHAELIYGAAGIYYRIEELGEAVLDILATDLHADWYDYEGSLAEKRKLIANDVLIHRSMGTVDMLRRVLESIHGDCAIEEWFEYGGNPYYFRVAMDITDPEEVIDHRRIIKAIKVYKPVRAHLEGENIAYRAKNAMQFSETSDYVLYDVRRAGTFPDAAVLGAGGNGVIVLTGRTTAGIIDPPRSGSAPAGVFPAISTLGASGSTAISAAGEAAGVAYTAPLCGENL